MTCENWWQRLSVGTTTLIKGSLQVEQRHLGFADAAPNTTIHKELLNSIVDYQVESSWPYNNNNSFS